MRYHTGRILVSGALVLVCTSLFAQDCNISVGDKNPVQDITRILRCMDERIKFLESQLNASGSPQAAAERQSVNSEFDAGSFAVSVRSATRAGNSVNVLLSLRNKTTEDVHIAVEGKSGEGATLFDEGNGNSENRVQGSGIKMVSSWSKREEYSAIPGGSMISVAYKFDGAKIQGSSARLNLLFTEYAAPNVKKVTVSLGLRIRN